jgi:hypothetical protein
MPFLKDLWAVRVVLWCGSDDPSGEGSPASSSVVVGTPEFMGLLRQVLSSGDYEKLRYIGVGPSIYETQGWEEVTERVPVAGSAGDEAAFREEVVRRRKVVEISREEVKDVAIWKYDTLDVL